MAIIINQLPPHFNLLTDPIDFVITMTGTNTATTVKRFGYQLKNDNGEAVSGIEAITPKEGIPFRIRFNEDIRRVLRTEVPGSCNFPKVNRPEMFQEFYMEYFEIVFDRETCETTLEAITTSNGFGVLNSCEQYFTEPEGPTLLLNVFPRYLELCRGKCNMFYTYADRPGTLRIHAVHQNGSTMYDENEGLSGAQAIGINSRTYANEWLNNTGLGDAGVTTEQALCQMARIDIYLDGQLRFSYLMIDCCEINEIAFQSGGGGYSFMQFDELDSLSVSSSFSEVCKYQPGKQPYNLDFKTKGGLSIINKVSYKLRTFTKVISEEDVIDLKYYEDFLSSGSYFYKEPETGLVKFIPNSGNIKYYQTERFFILTITGKIAQPHNLPNYEV